MFWKRSVFKGCEFPRVLYRKIEVKMEFWKGEHPVIERGSSFRKYTKTMEGDIFKNINLYKGMKKATEKSRYHLFAKITELLADRNEILVYAELKMIFRLNIPAM